MSKQFKSHKKQNRQSDFDAEAEDLDVRIERQLFLTSELQQQLTFCSHQLQYSSLFLQNIKGERQRMGKHYLLDRVHPFGGWQSKLKQLTVSAISNESNPVREENKQNQNIQNQAKGFSQKKHLEEILADKTIKNEEEEIAQLEKKVQSLYTKIGEMVSEEYMNDKITVKIKRQAKKASKVKTLGHIEKQLLKYRNWVQEKDKKINNEIISKDVQSKIVHNLEFMKLLMNKKVINNDYIYEQFQENNLQNQKVIDKINTLSSTIQQKYEESRKFFQEKLIQQQNTKIKPIYESHQEEKQLDISQIKNYLREVEQTLDELDDYYYEEELVEQSRRLNKKLEQMSSSVK